jgi:hypothetical protein
MLTILLSSSVSEAQQRTVETELIAVAGGWHPWYQLKADPEDASNLIICGTRRDVRENAFLGFVYASSDGGRTWSRALEDRNSAWVTEQSCAFGSGHKAYFVSEAANVIDGEPQRQGTTRLFVSSDAGQHWTETLHTGWADWSSSAVSRVTGNLLTFFNYADTGDQTKNWGSSIGLIVFSPDGKGVSGPFADRRMKKLAYHIATPSDALALSDGTVIALYMGTKDAPSGQVMDLGVVRVEPSPSPSPTFSVIASSDPQSKKGCLHDHSFAYDEERKRLFAVYGEDIGNACRLMLTTSLDGGKTWSRGVPVTLPQGENGKWWFFPSIAVGADGNLGLLWTHIARGGPASGKWFFSTVAASGLAEPPVELYAERWTTGVINDALWSQFYEPGSYQPESDSLAPTVALQIRTVAGRVWRSSESLLASGNRLHAVFLVLEKDHDELFSVLLRSSTGEAKTKDPSPSPSSPDVDVTNQVKLLYGGPQSFDNKTGILSLGVRLANRGDTPILTPIRLQVKTVGSKVGKVTILNADNGLDGPGAIWDLSQSVAGDQILPDATTHFTFTLLFHIDLEDHGSDYGLDLLDLSAKVLACADVPCAVLAGSKR